MLTRRNLLVNGLPAALATAGVCVNMEAIAEPSLEELLAWADMKNIGIHRWMPLRAYYISYFLQGKLEVTEKYPTLREALLKAKCEIEKGRRR